MSELRIDRIRNQNSTGGLEIVGNTTISDGGNDVTISAGGIDASAGVVTALAFVGDGSGLTGVSGFATALSSDQTSPLNKFFKTPAVVEIGAGTSVSVESDATSGNVAFVREGTIHVAAGATFRVVSGNSLIVNVLDVFP